MKTLSNYICEFKVNNATLYKHYSDLISFNYEVAKQLNNSLKTYSKLTKTLYNILKDYIDAVYFYLYIKQLDEQDESFEVPMCCYNEMGYQTVSDVLPFEITFSKKIGSEDIDQYLKQYTLSDIVGDQDALYVNLRQEDLNGLKFSKDLGVLYPDDTFIFHNRPRQECDLPVPEMFIAFKKEHIELAIDIFNILNDHYQCDISRDDDDDEEDGVDTSNMGFIHMPGLDEAIYIMDGTFRRQNEPYHPGCVWVVLDQYKDIEDINNTIDMGVISKIKKCVNKYKQQKA